MKTFSDLVSKNSVSGFEAAARESKANKAWLDTSFKIALLILARLKALGWKQTQLASAMNVSPQYISKIVRGKENLTIETIAALEQVLNIKLIQVESFALPKILVTPSSNWFPGMEVKVNGENATYPATTRKSYKPEEDNKLSLPSAA